MLTWWVSSLNTMRLQVGGLKVTWLPYCGTRRSIFDVIVHGVSLAVLVIITFCRNPSTQSIRMLGLCLLYLCVFDPLYIGDYFIAPIVLLMLWACLPTPRGSLAGMQATMICLMVGAGLSKVGPHYDRPGTGVFAVAVASYLPPPVVDLLWRGRDDLRPSGTAQVLGVMMTLFEVCTPFLLLSSSKVNVGSAVGILAAMHATMSFASPVLGFLELWCVATWCFLFLGGDERGPRFGFDYAGARAMPRCVKALGCLFLALNLWGQLQPDLDWHPLLKYNHFASGNQPCSQPMLVRKTVGEKLRTHLLLDPQTAAAWATEDSADNTLRGLAIRWLIELNHKPSAAVIDQALEFCGGDAKAYRLTTAEEFTRNLAGWDSSSMNSYNLRFFQEVIQAGFLDRCDALLVWLAPVSWPILPLGRQASRWSIWDGSEGLLMEGALTAEELQSVALPSEAGGLLARNGSRAPVCPLGPCRAAQ